MSKTNTKAAQVGQHWNKLEAKAQPKRTRYWMSPHVIRSLNARVCGRPVPGPCQGLFTLLKEEYADSLPFKRAISVGCGSANKEIRMLKLGLVEHFDLYELSETRRQMGLKALRNAGLEDRVSFHLADAFEEVTEAEQFDLVFWAASLHHMMDTNAAVAWSKKILKPGGVLAIDDFVGPTRMQWSDFALDVATKIRQGMADKYMISPHDPERTIARRQGRPNPERLAEADPSECADSSNILPAIDEHFPGADVRPIGGMVMHTAMNDTLANIDEEEDKTILNLLLIIDELCAELGEVYRAVIIAQK